MQARAIHRQPADGHLWMIAGSLSLLANVGILAMAGMAALQIDMVREPVPATPVSEQAMVTIHAVAAEETTAERAAERQRFARTSPEQAGEPVENPAFIGERNTRAASERTPVADAPPLPSQAGIEPRDETDIETTESDYQDGELAVEKTSTPSPEAAAAPSPPSAPAQEAKPSVAASAAPPAREKLLEGPNPVDVQVPRETANGEKIKPTPEPRPAVTENTPPTPAVAEQPKPKATDKPVFRGNQRKTAIVGSISRTGRSSLDVEDSALGRYQAIISRAVELEWQRNCVRHRDLITPGFLTVRFFVETSGKVRTVQFVGDMETGEVQKGFTLNSIRDATIPPMPSSLRREYEKEPLELIFRFYF